MPFVYRLAPVLEQKEALKKNAEAAFADRQKSFVQRRHASRSCSTPSRRRNSDASLFGSGWSHPDRTGRRSMIVSNSCA